MSPLTYYVEFVEDVDGATNDTIDAHDSSHSADDQGDVISANSGTGTSTLDTEHGTQEAGLDDTENGMSTVLSFLKFILMHDLVRPISRF